MLSAGSNNGVSATYAIPHASMTEDEVTRLDAMHEGYKDYLDGRLSFAPLEGSKPKAILELGTGSGLWAIQAANQFPDAKVLAVDLSPLPTSRIVPPNMTFRTLNLMEPFPFENETFDIIHARLVFMHIPKPDEIIQRVIKLLKPGGWLLLEDLHFVLVDRSDLPLGPGMKGWCELWENIKKSRGVDNGIPEYDKTLAASGIFGEVNVKTILFPISEKSDDPKRNRLGAAYRTSLQRLAHNVCDSGPEFTRELTMQYCEELSDPRRNITSTVLFTWARKQTV